MAKLHLDLESRSDLDLRKIGVYEYARGRKTDLMCAAFAFDDEQVRLWLPGQGLPRRVFDHIEAGGEVHAHNFTFEWEMVNSIATRKYGWPYLYVQQGVCTMAMSYAMGLPGHLGSTAAALGIIQQKDMVGNRLMLQYCQPREIKDGKIIWWDDKTDLERIYNYCRQDVEVERAIGKRMMKLSPYEQSIWQLDQKINAIGIKVDLPAVNAAILLVEEEKERLNGEMRRVSGNQIATCTAVQQIKDYLYLRGVPDVDSLAKADVTDLLASKNLPDDCRKIIELRKEAGKSSTAKLEAMRSRASPQDSRVRGGYQYSGANTRRWAGRGLQLQNLPRSKINATVVDKILVGLTKGLNANEIDLLYGPPLDVISSCLRGFLVSDSDADLIACDFSSIEARVIAWLAGEETALEIFRTHGKIYEHAASRIFNVALDEVSESQRQIGKVAVLALGYGGGVGALQTMARGYGVSLAPAYEVLVGLADFETLKRCEDMFNQNKHRYDEISREEYIASDLTKIFWREANPKIVQFWRELQHAAITAVQNPMSKITAGKIAYLVNGSFLWCKLPSGGVIVYPYPKVEKVELPWGGKTDGLTYMSEDGQSKKWMRFKTYGGSLAENVTQAVARDLLADAMLRLESAKYTVVAHVHDEIVCELMKGTGSLEEMSKIMCESPEWAKGLPVKAGGWRGNRYRK